MANQNPVWIRNNNQESKHFEYDMYILNLAFSEEKQNPDYIRIIHSVTGKRVRGDGALFPWGAFIIEATTCGIPVADENDTVTETKPQKRLFLDMIGKLYVEDGSMSEKGVQKLIEELDNSIQTIKSMKRSIANFKCIRCGKCCILKKRDVKFKSDREESDSLMENIRMNFPKLYPLMESHMSVGLPLKRNFLDSYEELGFKPEGEEEYAETDEGTDLSNSLDIAILIGARREVLNCCLFLDYEIVEPEQNEGRRFNAVCLIYRNKPRVCDEYPFRGKCVKETDDPCMDSDEFKYGVMEFNKKFGLFKSEVR